MKPWTIRNVALTVRNRRKAVSLFHQGLAMLVLHTWAPSKKQNKEENQKGDENYTGNEHIICKTTHLSVLVSVSVSYYPKPSYIFVLLFFCILWSNLPIVMAPNSKISSWPNFHMQSCLLRQSSQSI